MKKTDHKAKTGGGKPNLPLEIGICLGNHLLGVALGSLIGQSDDSFHVVVHEGALFKSALPPDIVLFDAHHCHDEFFSQWPNARFVLIDSGLDEIEINCLIVRHRVDGIISKDMPTNLLKKALYAVSDGKLWIGEKYIRSALHHSLINSRYEHIEYLTEKEKQIVHYIVEGYKNKEISDQINLSEQTVKAHVSKIFRKLNISSRAQLIHLAMKNFLR